MFQILNILTLESEYFTTLSALIRKYKFTESTVRNKWAKEKKQNPDEVVIIIGNYRINKVKIQ